MDRNYFPDFSGFWHGKSLSARRAWIEICGGAFGKLLALVALRKESVDRNVFLTLTVRNVPSRSPQGERG